jgi:hypothetical protein
LIFLTYIFIALAAVCNALMDIVENENFHVSVFKNLNQKFWYKRESWKYAKQIGGYKVDAWHLAKSLMIILICGAIVNYNPFIPVIDFIILGTVWNLTFIIFYKLFKTL